MYGHNAGKPVSSLYTKYILPYLVIIYVGVSSYGIIAHAQSRVRALKAAASKMAVRLLPATMNCLYLLILLHLAPIVALTWRLVLMTYVFTITLQSFFRYDSDMASNQLPSYKTPVSCEKLLFALH